MSNVLTVIADPAGPAIDDNTVATVHAALDACGAEPEDAPRWLRRGGACDLLFGRGDPIDIQKRLRERLGGAPFDVVAQPRAGRRRRLLVADMESTIIANEFVDELAAEAGVGDAVAAITARVMRGELEFAAALEARVARLAGLPAAALDRVYARVAFTPGARALVRTMRAYGACTALVSGGFTCFSARVREALGFDYDFANTIEIADGRITGKLAHPVLDRAGKKTRLTALAAERGIDSADTLAVGDGANDLDMIEAAGMGVAFHGKPVLAERARARIDHGDLTALLYIQGYHAEEFRG
ncbi:MAG: phosphoserine phosphatase SerB [Alphaproteobacteria bacterium]